MSSARQQIHARTNQALISYRGRISNMQAASQSREMTMRESIPELYPPEAHAEVTPEQRAQMAEYDAWLLTQAEHSTGIPAGTFIFAVAFGLFVVVIMAASVPWLLGLFAEALK